MLFWFMCFAYFFFVNVKYELFLVNFFSFVYWFKITHIPPSIPCMFKITHIPPSIPRMFKNKKKPLFKMCTLLLSFQCVFQPGQGWTRGGYQCICRHGFYSLRQKGVFNGTLIEGKNFPYKLNMSFCRKWENNGPCSLVLSIKLQM